MPTIQPHTVAELIYWSYANLAMAHDGINRGLPTYDKTSFIIRMRMYNGLLSGKMQVSSLFKDERWKMENSVRCVVLTDKPPIRDLFKGSERLEDVCEEARQLEFVFTY